MFRRSGIYLGWVGFQNLGDEAMWHVCQQRFPSVRWSVADNLNTPIATGTAGRVIQERGLLLRVLKEEFRDARRLRLLAHQCRHRIESAAAGEVGILGGGTLINRNQAMLDAYVSLRKKLQCPIPVFGTGVANREYWQKTEDWSDLRGKWAEALQELPVVGVRGPQSKAELDDAGLRNVVICGDPAVMLHEPLGVASEPKERLTIAINFGDPAGGMAGSESAIEDKLCRLAQLIARKHNVKLLPVWPKDVPACSRLAVRANLPGSAITPACTTHQLFREELRSIDFLIAFKLHAGILAAAYNVPFLMLDYQPKCRDFASSLGWESYCVRPDDFEPEFALNLVDELERCGDVWRKEICRKMCDLARTFENYCERISPLLLQ